MGSKKNMKTREVAKLAKAPGKGPYPIPLYQQEESKDTAADAMTTEIDALEDQKAAIESDYRKWLEAIDDQIEALALVRQAWRETMQLHREAKPVSLPPPHPAPRPATASRISTVGPKATPKPAPAKAGAVSLGKPTGGTVHLEVGDVVKTSYQTGPYRIVKVIRFGMNGNPCVHLQCVKADLPVCKKYLERDLVNLNNFRMVRGKDGRHLIQSDIGDTLTIVSRAAGNEGAPKPPAKAKPALPGPTFATWCKAFVLKGGPDPTDVAMSDPLVKYAMDAHRRKLAPHNAVRQWKRMQADQRAAGAGTNLKALHPTPPSPQPPTPSKPAPPKPAPKSTQGIPAPRIVDGFEEGLDYDYLMQLANQVVRLPSGQISGCVMIEKREFVVIGMGEDETPGVSRFYCQEVLPVAEGAIYDTWLQRKAKTPRGVPISLTGVKMVLHPQLEARLFGPEVIAVRMDKPHKSQPAGASAPAAAGGEED